MAKYVFLAPSPISQTLCRHCWSRNDHPIHFSHEHVSHSLVRIFRHVSHHRHASHRHVTDAHVGTSRYTQFILFNYGVIYLWPHCPLSPTKFSALIVPELRNQTFFIPTAWSRKPFLYPRTTDRNIQEKRFFNLIYTLHIFSISVLLFTISYFLDPVV